MNRRLWQSAARRPRPPDLYKIVYTQLNAFRATEDYSTAYSQASNGIQHKFNPDPVRGNDPHREHNATSRTAERVEFGLVICREQHATMQVFFVEHDGSVLPCIYSLILRGER